jgi:GATA zinc finger
MTSPPRIPFHQPFPVTTPTTKHTCLKLDKAHRPSTLLLNNNGELQVRVPSKIPWLVLRWCWLAMPPSLSNLRTGSYLSSVQEHQVSQWQQSTASAQGGYIDAIPSPTYNNSRPLTPPYPYSPTSHNLEHSPSDVVPPPRRRISPTARETGPTRTPTNRPAGILKCSSCKATSSPEWRKGPSGKKELCNA